jgi:transcriptional regulator with PAS, ATPase and Fis domain
MTRQDVLGELFSVLNPYPLNSIIARAIRFCFRNPYEGLVVVDKEGIIQFMDRPTERFFGREPGGAQGMSIREIVPKSDFELVMTSGAPVIGRIGEIGGVRRIASVYPLKKNGEVIGALGRVAFHPFEEIEKRNKEIHDLKNEVQYLRQKEKDEYSSLYTFDNILGSSKSIKDTLAKAKRISMLDTDVLIVGESGTGKELFAHGIHSYLHKARPFTKVNCPAIPFELAESQFFGYEKGAFTGASSSGKAGIFESAHNGIVFLDEISSLPLSLQAKLLRVLQEREIQRVGSSKTVRVNFRFIAATNEDLFKLLEEGKFRSDLYYRVARVTLRIPPLRQRREDIPFYLNHFLRTINKSFNSHIRGFSGEAMHLLLEYDWPGNVRQLIHVVEQIAINAWDVDEITVEHLPKEILLHAKPSHEGNFTDNTIGIRQEMDYKERDAIISALRQTKGNKRRAAMLIKMPRSTFYQKIKRYGIRGIR